MGNSKLLAKKSEPNNVTTMNSFHKEIANNMLGTDDTSHHTAYHCPLILKDSLEYHRSKMMNIKNSVGNRSNVDDQADDDPRIDKTRDIPEVRVNGLTIAKLHPFTGTVSRQETEQETDSEEDDSDPITEIPQRLLRRCIRSRSPSYNDLQDNSKETHDKKVKFVKCLRTYRKEFLSEEYLRAIGK